MKFHKLSALLALILAVSIAFEAGAQQKGDPRLKVLSVMKQELLRSKENLKLEDYVSPYFIAYQVKDAASFDITAMGGALHRSYANRTADIYLEARVGDYEFDNTSTMNISGFSFDFGGFYDSRSAPIEEHEVALRQALWLMTDQAYKRALSTYHKKKGQKVYETEEDKPDAFSREDPEKFIGPRAEFKYEKEKWERVARELSTLFNEHNDIYSSSVRIAGDHETRYFANTEGSEIVTETTYYGVIITAKARAEDGMMVSNEKSFYARDIKNLPDEATLKGDTKKLITELLELRKAPVLDPYTGPAILEAEAAGVLFHEVIGHRLEGERQNDDKEGRTFKDQLGKKIIPEFLDVIDDPTLDYFNGTQLNGFYKFDEEGVKAQRVLLVEKGILKNYLLSRTPIKDFKKSNGHGRSSGGSKPQGRMANTIVKSHKEVSSKELKKKLIEMVKAQDKPYGLIFKDVSGGSTNTSTFGYQAFNGIPRRLYKIYPDGREELVRGVEMVGTPLSSINKIVATSDRYETFNGFCGAESGFIPVSATAPEMLLEEIELQRTRKDSEKPPILPKPGSKEEREEKKK